MRYVVTTPERTHSGTVAGVTFHEGRAEVDSTQTAALSYFRRRGYGVDPVGKADPTVEAVSEPSGPGSAEVPKRPAVNEQKATWVAYVVATGLMTQEDAEKSTKDDLIKATATSEENGQ